MAQALAFVGDLSKSFPFSFILPSSEIRADAVVELGHYMSGSPEF